MNKMVYTDEDFETMSWHDNTVYSMDFPDSKYFFSLYLDYILEWRKIENSGFDFLIAPAVLTFENVSDLKVELDFYQTALEIDEIQKIGSCISPNRKMILYNYEVVFFDQGTIRFTASGFTQKLTAEPKFSKQQIYER
jgi:hypothetical protein